MSSLAYRGSAGLSSLASPTAATDARHEDPIGRSLLGAHPGPAWATAYQRLRPHRLVRCDLRAHRYRMRSHLTNLALAVFMGAWVSLSATAASPPSSCRSW